MAFGKTPTDQTWNVTRSSDCIVDFTVTDSAGDPFDITDYEFYFVARERRNTSVNKIIEILNANIVQSDSGSGTVDTFTIDITNSLSNVSERVYYYEIRSKYVPTGDNDVWFNGNLNIQWSVQEAR